MTAVHRMLPGLLVLGVSVAFVLGYGTFENTVVVLLTVLVFRNQTLNLRIGETND